MKLIDGDRLLKLMAGGGDPDYAHHLETNLFPKCTLDPADLDKMNLAALRVLENLKISLEDMKTGLSKRHPGRTINVEVGAIFELIHTLESAADLGAAQLIQEKAKAWDETIPQLLEEQALTMEALDNLEKKLLKNSQALAEFRAELATGPAKALRQGSG